ncbi:hypothetical protein PCK1_000757 [Pneumocystis canis]|nr:hypothetical protein PCK1_000757 [Pneumocystis canis]
MQFLHYKVQPLVLDKTGFNDSINQEKGLNVTIVETDGINLYVGTLNGDILFFFNFPELSPKFGLHSIKGVIEICQDLDKLGETEADGSVILTVLTKKKIKRIKVKDSISLISDIDYSSPVTACQRGFVCCVANNLFYELIDFENNEKITLFPILQGSDVLYYNFSLMTSLILTPIIISITRSEFLVTTYSSNGENAIGLFINTNGDIVRGTVMFSEYPMALASEFPFLMALMDRSFVEIHNVIDQTLVQVVQSPFLGSITKISPTYGHFSVLVESLLEKIVIVEFMSSKYVTSQAIDADNHKLLEEMAIAIRLSNIPSKNVLIGATGMSCLMFNSFLVHVDAFLDLKDIDNALLFIENLSQIMIPENIHSERIYHELSYIYQKIGFIYLEKTLFDKAIVQFEKSDIDPRLIISFFPVFNVKLKGIMVYKGIDDVICKLMDIDNIISSGIAEKFDSSMLSSDDKVQTSEDYGKILQKKRLGNICVSEKDKQIFGVVDSALLKLLVYLSPDEDSSSLYELIDSGIECFDNAVTILEENKKYFLLSKLYESKKMHNKVLEIWKNILDGAFFDEEFLNGEEKMKNYLYEIDDDNLCIDYGIWLIERIQHIGNEFFVNISSKKTFKLSIDEMVNIIRSRSKICLKIYLEYVVSSSNSYNLSFLNELLLLYMSEIISYLEIPLIRDAVKQSIVNYRESMNDKLPYFEYMSTCMVQSDNEYKEFILDRIKLIDLLQSTSGYDLEFVLKFLSPQKDLLVIELVILYGRSDRHEEALTILIQTLRDYKTSEIYCYHRGLSIKLFYDNQETEEFLSQRKELFQLLLDQYLELLDYDQKHFRVSLLLKRWSIYLDAIHVLKVISADWSVEKISSFFINIFQKTIQEKYHSHLNKSLHRSTCMFYDYSALMTAIDKSS